VTDSPVEARSHEKPRRDGVDFEPRREDPALEAGLGVDPREEGLEALRDIGCNKDEDSGVEGRVEGRVEDSLPGMEAPGDITVPLTIVLRYGCNEAGKGSGVEGRTAFSGFNGGVGGRLEATTGAAIDFDERREDGSDRIPGLEALRDIAFSGFSGVEELAALPDVNDFDGRREDGSDHAAGAAGVGNIKPLLPALRKRLCAAPPGIEFPEDAFLSAIDESLNSIACKRSLRAATSSAAASKRSSLLCWSVL